MRHVGRRTIGLILFLVVSMTLSGCIFFDQERRKNFTGPSLDVPITVPLTTRQELSMGELLGELLGLEADDEGTFGFNVESDLITIPVPDFEDLDLGEWNPIGSSRFEFEIEKNQIDLAKLADLDDLDDSSIAFTKLVLTLDVFNEPGLMGELELTLTSIFSDGSGSAYKQEPLMLDDSAYPAPVRFDIDLSDKPTALELSGILTVDTADGLPAPGELAIQPRVWLPIGFNIGSDGLDIEWSDPEPMGLDEQDRDTLRKAPISAADLVFDVESSSQIGFEIGLKFFDGADDQDSVPVRLTVPPNVKDFEHTVSINEEVRKKLIAPDAHWAMKVDFFGTDGGEPVTIREDDTFSFKLYAIVTVDINKQED